MAKAAGSKAAGSKAKTGKSLVIVESPAKAKTINKYLGSDFIVKASMGHVRDMPRSGLQVDLKTFQPTYSVLPEKTKVITELKKLAKDAPDIYLATDLDREGEAIAWHLQEALGIPPDQVKRVIFNAITKTEIQRAFSNPHPINMHRVNAQQARRVLDRLVGYEISPVLWRKVARGLSAGRVQSVAVRLVVEREREIEAFVPAEYWKIAGVFTADGGKAGKHATDWAELIKSEAPKAERERFLTEREAFVAELVEFGGKRFEPTSAAMCRAAAEAVGLLVRDVVVGADEAAKGPARHPTTIVGTLGGSLPPFVVEGIERKRSTSKPSAPFITSTLQQAAASRLGMGAQRAMRVAQGLYESGHITYMRTDSTHLSGEALTMVREYIPRTFGPKYLPEKPNFYSSSNKDAQEAHEAIRPTEVALTPTAAREKLGADEARLYQLIWNRFVACQMTPAEFDQTAVTITAATKAGPAKFRATGRKLVFDGFMRVTGVASEDQLLPELAQGRPVFPIQIDPTQHFTQPPARYTEASLVKKLEEEGIGRPSTYASITQTIQDREYVTQVDRRFHATQLGMVVTDKLVQAFPNILDVRFTAGMENDLDRVEDQDLDWVNLLREFYGPFHESVEGSLEKIEHAGGAPSNHNCPKCGKPMLYRISKNGFFLACQDRECNTTQPVDFAGKPQMREKSEIKCPKCGREMLKRSGRFGDFLGCTGYSVKDEAGKPSCDMILNLDKEGNPQPPKVAIETSVPCEKCGRPMKLRDSKRGPFLGCSGFPKCRATRQVAKLEGSVREYVDKLVPGLKQGGAEAARLAAEVGSQFQGQLGEAPKRLDNLATDIDCDECGEPMRIKKGKRGYFLGCSGYPKCRNTGEVPAKLIEELGIGENGNGKSDDSKGKSGKSVALDEVDLSLE
jgi:DNA topoisomerase I